MPLEDATDRTLADGPLGALARGLAAAGTTLPGDTRWAAPLAVAAVAAVCAAASSASRWLQLLAGAADPAEILTASLVRLAADAPLLTRPVRPLVAAAQTCRSAPRGASALRAAARACLDVPFDALCDADRAGGLGGDLLGLLHGEVRPVAGPPQRHRPTAAAVCALVAELFPVTEGDTVVDPACGTGTLLHAHAASLRARGGDPRRCVWVGADRDALAVALCALNTVAWGLGPNVVVVHGEILRDGR